MSYVIRILCLLGGAMIAAYAADVNSLLASARSAETDRHFDQAENAYNAALELTIAKERKLLSPTAVEVAIFYSRQQKRDKAEAVLKRALAAEERTRQPTRVKIPVLMQLQTLYQSPQKAADLVKVQTSLVKAWESLAGPGALVVANNLYRLGGALQQTGEFAQSERALRRAIAILEKTYGSDAPPVGFVFGRLASVESRLGRDDLAREALGRESAAMPKPAPNAPKAGGGVTAPHVISRESPKYSERARKNGTQGAVILLLALNENGEPSDVTVLLPLGDGLDERAVEAVRKWRFGAQAAPVQATIEVNFRLL